MGLEAADVVDAVGTEIATGEIVLTLLDAWDWSDEHAHLLALQTKLNAYFEFVGSGQLEESYPDAVGRSRRIAVMSRYPLPPAASTLLEKAAALARSELDLGLTQAHHPG